MPRLPEGPHIYGDGGLAELHTPPEPNWECCFGGDWRAMTIRQYWRSPPNLFQRWMQRLILGVHWRKV